MLGVVVHDLDPRIREAEDGRSPRVWCQPDRHKESQASQGYTVSSYQNKQKTHKNQNNNTTTRNGHPALMPEAFHADSFPFTYVLLWLSQKSGSASVLPLLWGLDCSGLSRRQRQARWLNTDRRAVRAKAQTASLSLDFQWPSSSPSPSCSTPPSGRLGDTSQHLTTEAKRSSGLLPQKPWLQSDWPSCLFLL